MSISERIRESINYLFIFSTINDDFIVNHIGGMSLKVILGAFVLVNINRLLSFRYNQRYNRPFICLIITMILAMVVNMFRYNDIGLAINSFIAISVIFVVFSQEENPEKYIKWYIISALFSSFLCITAIDTVEEYTFRKTGGTGDPNEFSVTILIPLGIILGKLLKSNKIKEKIILIAIVLTFSISLLLAGSKSAMLTLVLLILVFAGYISSSSKTKHRVFVISGGLLLIVGIGIVINEYFGDVLQLMINRFDKTGSAQERFLSWEAGSELFKASPFFGVGLGNYSNMVGIHFHSIVETSRAAHNMYMQALVELGFIGCIPFLWFVFKPLHWQIKNRIYPLQIVFGYIPLLLMGFTLSLLVEKYVWVFYAFLYNQNTFFYNEKYENS